MEQIYAATSAAERFTVIDKTLLPPSGDAHDYASFGPYWWPDSSKPDGLPYIRRDGETNPTSGGDRAVLYEFCNLLFVLFAKARLEDTVTSARRAGRLLHEWFLAPATRMNPHLRYAQGIPGHCEGRSIGIIDTWVLCFLVDEIAQLPLNDDWTPLHREGVRAWFSDYLDWLLNSPEGAQECAEANNHGTWFDAQVVCIALFCGRDDVAKRQIDRFFLRRVKAHFAADGSQPHELVRTLSLSYCTFNLLGFACVAQAARHLGIDLWHLPAAHGVQLVQGVRWLLPYYAGERPWNWPQITPFQPSRACLLLNLAFNGTRDPAFESLSRSLSLHPFERMCPLASGAR